MVVTLRSAPNIASKTCIKLHHLFHGSIIPCAAMAQNWGYRPWGSWKSPRGWRVGRGISPGKRPPASSAYGSRSYSPFFREGARGRVRARAPTFHRTLREPGNELPLQSQKQRHHGRDGNDRAGHEEAVAGGIQFLPRRDGHREREFIRRLQDDLRADEVIPAAEAGDEQGGSGHRADERQHHGGSAGACAAFHSRITGAYIWAAARRGPSISCPANRPRASATRGGWRERRGPK